MAGSIVKYVVDISSRGLKGVKDGLQGIGRSLRDNAAANRDATRAARDLHSTQSKGVIGTANSTKSFSKLAETIGSGGGGLVGAYATLAANIFAVTAAFNALRSAAQVEQVLNGLTAAGTRTGRALDMTAMRVKALSGDMLSAEQAMRSTAQFMAGGFKTKELERMTLVAKDVSFALGRNMQDSMDRLTRGIVKLEPELLDELGIMTKLTESNVNYARSIGKSESQLTSFEKRQGFMNAVLAEGELKFGGLSKAAGDSTAFDKLAATFADLVKDIFGAVNVIAKPLAALFAESKTGLVGLMLLLASTISSQLIPGLSNISGKALKAAEGMHAMALASAKAAKAGTDLGPAYNTVFKKFEKGKATMRDFAKAQAALNQELEDADFLRSDPSNSRRDQKLYDKDYARVVKAKSSLNELQSASGRAAAKEGAANAIAEASSGSVLGGLLELKDSISDFGETTDKAGKPTGFMSKAIFAVGNSVQFAAAAFLRFLPYIGIFITLGGLVYNWFNKVTPAQEEYNKKLEEYNTLLQKTGEYVEEYNRVQNSMASASQRSSAAIKVQSNAIMETVGAYRTLAEARKAMLEADANAEKLENKTSFREKYLRSNMVEKKVNGKTRLVQRDPDDISDYTASKRTGLPADDLALGSFGTMMQKSDDKEGKALIQQLSALSRLDPKGFKTFVDEMGGPAQIKAANYAKRLEYANNVIDKMDEKHDKAQKSVVRLEEAFVNADRAAADFIRSSVMSTPFDQLAEGTQQANFAVRQLNIDFRNGVIDARDYLGQLSGIGSQLQNILNPNVRETVNEFRKIDTEIKALEIKGPRRDAGDNNRLKSAYEERRTAASQMEVAVRRGLIDGAKMTQQLQEQSRVLEGQLKLRQAQLSTIQGIYALNGKGLLEQYAQEEKARDLQVQRLNLEITLHENIIAQNESKLKQVEIEKATLFLKTMQAAADRRAYQIEKAREEKNKERLDQLQSSLISFTEVLEDPSYKLGMEQIQLNLDEIKMASDAGRASITNLRNEVSAILAANLDRAQKEARAMQKDYEVTQKYVDLLREQAEALNAISNIQIKLRKISEGSVEDLSTEIELLQRGTQEQKDKLRVEHTNRLEEIKFRRAVHESDKNRAESIGESAEGAKIELRNLDAEIVSRGRILELQELLLDRTQLLSTLEKVVFDTRREGLDWQKEALAYREKEVDLVRELQIVQLKNAQIREKNSLQRRDIASSESLNAAHQLENQMQAYNMAVKEVALRESMIDLEYALLDAQRIALREELDARKYWLMATTKLGEDSVQIRQLTSAITALDDASNINSLRDMAKGILRENLETMRLEIQSASTTQNEVLTGFQKLASEYSGALRNQQAQRAGRAISQPGALSSDASPKVTAEFNDNKVSIEVPAVDDKLKQILPVMVSVQSNISQIAADVRTLVNNSAQGSGAVNASGRAKQAMDYFMAQLGLTAEQAAGIVGNLQVESRLQENGPRGDGGKAYGLAQWHPERQAKFMAAYGKSIIGSTFEEQLRFIVKELKDGYGGALTALKGTRNVGDAATVIDRKYEQSAGLHTDRRIAEANKLVTAGVAQAATVVAATEQQTEVVVSAIRAAANDNEIPPAPEVVLKGAALSGAKSDVGGLLNSLPDLGLIQPVKPNVRESIDIVRIGIASTVEELRKLGPQGEVVAAFSEGMGTIASVGETAFKKISDDNVAMSDKIMAGLSVVSSVISMISSIVSANADARIEAIDREINAEQRRDGKSAESQAKLESLEKRKDQIARKAFNLNKKLQMGNAIINTAAAVTQALANLPPPLSYIMAGISGAMGAAQLAIIAGTSYQSTSAPNAAAAATPSTLTIGKRGDSVDVARHNKNVGGELGYLRGARGQGSNSGNFSVVGSAYGGSLPRGYGNVGFAVGEKGPEIIEPGIPMSVRPMNDNEKGGALPPVNFNIHALDARGVEDLLYEQRGNLIGMFREAANANGKTFLEDVNVNVYNSPNKKTGARRI
jgi:hypothetical protein